MKLFSFTSFLSLKARKILFIYLAFGLITSSFAQNGLFVEAGDDFTACANSIFVSGNAQNFESVAWSSSGDGTYSSPTNLVSEYFPGIIDMMTGQATLCLTAFSDGNHITDCLTLTIAPMPLIDIGVETATICYDEAYTFDNIVASNYEFVQWVTINGGGFFSNENELYTTYYPSSVADYSQGCVTIILYAQGQDPCNVLAEDQMELCFQPSPVIDIGGDTHYTCFGEDYTFADATAQHYTYLQWVNLTGGGYFINDNSINATYVPDPEFDYPQGCIVVLLFGEPISPCTGTIEEYVIICFQAPPEVDAGEDATIFSGNSFIPSPFVVNQGSVLWETSGDGTFDDPALLSPQYFSGIADQQTGTVVLTLNAFSDANCLGDYSDELILSVITQQSISLSAGLNGISTYVDVNDLDIVALTAPFADQLIFAQNGLQVFYPQFGINTFGNSTGLNGLIVNLSASTSIDFSGTRTTNTQIEIPEGWSLLPVPVSCSMGYPELIAQLGENLIIVAEVNGDAVIYPEASMFTLTELLPGKAYLIKMVAPAQLIFQTCN